MPHVAIERWAELSGLSPEDIHSLVDWLAERIAKGTGGEMPHSPSVKESAADKIEILRDSIRLAKKLRNKLLEQELSLDIRGHDPVKLALVRTELEIVDDKIRKMVDELHELEESKP